MDSFFDWVEKGERNLDMPKFIPTRAEASEETDTPKGEETTDEQRARTGWSANYPAAYFSAQYPKLWMAPRKATHDLDAEQMGRKSK